MGLDMYAFKTKEAIEIEVDFQVKEVEEIHYWRKHANLHETKGGKEEFNCVNVLLNLDDLNQLEKDLKESHLPETTGFFFGRSSGDEEEIAEDLEFISEARAAIVEGYKVYYTSWW
jgi:hypothetical protein